MSIEKVGRNQRIFALSKRGGGTMSYRELAEEYNVNVKTIWKAVTQEEAKLPKKKR